MRLNICGFTHAVQLSSFNLLVKNCVCVNGCTVFSEKLLLSLSTISKWACVPVPAHHCSVEPTRHKYFTKIVQGFANHLNSCYYLMARFKIVQFIRAQNLTVSFSGSLKLKQLCSWLEKSAVMVRPMHLCVKEKGNALYTTIICFIPLSENNQTCGQWGNANSRARFNHHD